MNRLEDRNDTLAHLYGISILLGFLLPHPSAAFMLINPLLCVLFQFFKQNQIRSRYNIIVIAPLLFTLIFNLPQDIQAKSILSSACICMYVFFFPIVGRFKVPNAYLYICFACIFFSQIIYMLNIPFFTELLDTVYPMEETKVNHFSNMRDNASVETALNYRFGGLFRNPNQCARYITFILAYYGITNYEGKRYKYIFLLFCFLGILLTGSRTGFFIASVILASLFLLDNKIPKYARATISVSVLIILFFAVLIGSKELRSLDISAGFHNSASSKMETFAYYLSNEDSFIRYLIGYFDPERFKPMMVGNVLDVFDSDYGNIIYCFGFLGFFAFVFYFYRLFINVNKVGRVFFILFLWSYSSTIIMSFRAFYLYMILLSSVYLSQRKTISSIRI